MFCSISISKQAHYTYKLIYVYIYILGNGKATQIFTNANSL